MLTSYLLRRASILEVDVLRWLASHFYHKFYLLLGFPLAVVCSMVDLNCLGLVGEYIIIQIIFFKLIQQGEVHNYPCTLPVPY